MAMTAKMTKLISLTPEIAEGMTRASKALGLSGIAYIEQCVARCLVQDVERVSLANKEHGDEVARLSASR